MNCAAEEETTSFYRNPDNNDSESSENFQKFITELFEKNGILNDLRAYLRGHIVGVLKSAGTGALPACQKHFTQRLELVYQALNMLIAEYLLKLACCPMTKFFQEFSYSLSVFVSEIPLANMVFEFARNILKTTDAQVSGLRFDENDVWSIIHYLGIKCDSVHAHKIVDLYKYGESPLLYCILKCIPMYHKEPTCVENVTSDELSSSVKSAESSDDQPVKRGRNHKCKHHALCTSCQNKLLRLREKYKRRKDAMGKNERRSSVNSLNVHSFMNRISLMEKSVIDEMFQQLQTVYEAEAEIIKEEEQRRVKRSIADHALELQKLREEMEESFKVREAELEKSVHQRKRFLWGLAKALRDQHQHMTQAMREVQHETKRLAEKESSIKIQLEEAEKTLKKRGEEMRNQISQELLTLEEHLETMKRERDSINREREELENLRNTYENSSKITKNDTDESLDLKAQYIALKNEVLNMKRERDSINREREEIENLRETYENKIKIMQQHSIDESVDLKTHYNALKDEVLTMHRERDSINRERDEIEILKNTYESKIKIMKQHDTDENIDLKMNYNALKNEVLAMKRERDSINREREEIENLRETYENKIKIMQQHSIDESVDLKTNYNALKNEVLAMKRERDSINREREEIENLRETYEDKIKIMKQHNIDESVDLKTHYNALKDEVLTMERERDSINREREKLENLKDTYESEMKIMKENYTDESVDLKTHYNTLKDEMIVLRKYIECAKLKGKSFIERGTMMDLGDGVMNNSVGVRGDDDDDRLRGTQVINDLKKQKNVNFSQSNLDEIYRQLSCSHSGSVNSTAQRIRGSDPDCATDGDNRTSDTVTRSNHGCHICDGDVMLQLREENDRLKTLARQQRGHIDALSSERQRLRLRLANPPRPRTAPSAMANNYFAPAAAAGMNRFGWRTGAGEQVNVFTASEPRVLFPSDAIPFIGVLNDRNTESRRHLISTWRALRPRLSPHTHSRPVAPLQRSSQESADSAELNGSTPSVQPPNADTICTTPHANIWKRPQKIQALDKPREKSPKSVLREAKEKLKNNVTKETPPPRDKSPNAVLREAKTRLRKLEIEAEAVEKSYLDFRKRQSELREERQRLVLAESSMMKSVKQLELKPSKTLQKVKPTENIASNETFNYEQSTENLKKDFDKYLRQYQTIDLGQIHFHKNSAMQKTKPIPPSYSEICDDNKEPKENYYLETPLIEFRKLYQTQNKEKRNDASHSKSPIPCPIEKPESDKSTESKSERNVPEVIRQMNIKQAEFEILKENISKIYPETSTPNETELDISKNTLNSTKTENLETDLPENIQENKLTLLVENVRETNNVGVTESQQDILLVVESSVDNIENDSLENEKQKISTQMTIIVTPKGDNDDSPTESKPPRKGSPKTLDKLTNNDALNAILNSDDDKGLFVDMKLELTKDLESDIEKDLKEEYFDDFSADVDNYYNENSISDGGNNSPISLPKTSEDDNFWEN